MRLWALFSALTAANLLTAAPQPTLKRDGSNWTLTEQGALTLDSAGNLTIKAAGNIRVRGASIPQLTYKFTRAIRATSSAGARFQLDRYPITAARQGTNALVQVAYGPFSMNLEINVPKTLQSVYIESPAGDIDVSDLSGALKAVTAGGRINIGHIGGDIDVRAAGGSIVIGTIGGNARVLSGGGSVNATEIRGDAVLETGGNDIMLRKAGGTVSASTAGGAIQILEARGAVVANTFGGPIGVGSAKAIRCESASGSIVARFLPGFSILDSFLSTGSGDITVWIPSNLQVSIRAQNEGTGNIGTVTSDFPGLHAQSEGATVLAELALNGGGPLLQLAGSGGRIYIKQLRATKNSTARKYQ